LEITCKAPIEFRDPDNPKDTEVLERNNIGTVYTARAQMAYTTYLGEWQTVRDENQNSDFPSERIQPNFMENGTQVVGSWTRQSDTDALVRKFPDRVINHVVFAIPQPGIVTAAQADTQKIPQPEVRGALLIDQNRLTEDSFTKTLGNTY
jgi:hypothetical protein